MKNVCNNLSNAKKFVFPLFTFNFQGVVINVNIWEEDVSPVVTHIRSIYNFIEKDDSHLYEAALTDDSNEVATTIAGYIAKKLINC